MSRTVYIPKDFTNLNEQFFRRLVKEISRVTTSINYNYTCDGNAIDNRYPIPHFMYAINEARKRNPRSKYRIRYGLNNQNISFKTILVQTSQVNGLIECGVPKRFKEIIEAIYNEHQMVCRHCDGNKKTHPHPDYELDVICDDCLLLRNQYLNTVIP